MQKIFIFQYLFIKYMNKLIIHINGVFGSGKTTLGIKLL